MKITAIKQQLRQKDRYSIFADGKYAFSLSEAALLESKLATGQELSAEQIREFKKLSEDDKLYNRALRYVSLRRRSKWEVEFYLQRKKASPALAESILNKLSKFGLIDDSQFAEAFIHDKQLLRPASRRKIMAELRKKHVAEEVIQKIMEEHDTEAEDRALAALIAQKRRQSRYQDDLKLMQYLARQGFHYEDIKQALARSKA